MTARHFKRDKMGETPSAGGWKVPRQLIRDLAVPEIKPDDILGQEIARLLTLHPDIEVSFRSVDLGELSQEDKEAMLEDLRELMDVQPLSSDTV